MHNKTTIVPTNKKKIAYLTQLTESWCAFFTALVWRLVIGSNKTIALFSQAAINNELKIKKEKINKNANESKSTIWFSEKKNGMKFQCFYKEKKNITHPVNILSYKRHQIRNPLPNYYSNSCMVQNVNKLICEFYLHSQYYVLVHAPVDSTMKIYPFQHRPSNYRDIYRLPKT